METKVIFHSDDFGMSEYSCRQILDCCDHGRLERVAIFANSPYYPQAVDLLRPYVSSGKLAVTAHLNLVEGKSVSPHRELPHLTDAAGYFKLSFGQMLFLTMLHPHGPLVEEIRTELRRQLQKVRKDFPETSIGVDSHQHFHMIPAVFRIVTELVDEWQIPITHLRFAAEPLSPFLKEISLLSSYRPINLVKNLLLNLLGLRDKKYLQGRPYETPLFFGLMLSGDMDRERVEKLLPHFIQIAERKHKNLEVLSHPCPVRNISECMDLRKKGFVAFYLSDGRLHEIEMLKS